MPSWHIGEECPQDNSAKSTAHTTRMLSVQRATPNCRGPGSTNRQLPKGF